jgi:WD40 repeat protein
VIPDSRWILFTVKKNNIASFNEAIIVAENLDTHERRELVNGGSFARYLPTGHIMYARGASLYAVPFDKKEVRVTGPPLPVIEGGMLNPFSGTANYEVSRTGVLIYTPLGPLSGLDNVVAWMDGTGAITPILKEPKPYDDLRLSPDNSRIAMTIRAANDDIWVYDRPRGALTRLTFGGGNSVLPDWTPNGKRVLFYSERGKQIGLFWKSWDGSGAIERIGDESQARVNFGSTFTPDGKTVIYSVNGDLWSVSVEGEQKRKPLMQSAPLEEAPRISPNGDLLAYLSDESGSLEVYVVPYPGLNGKWQISSGGATSPAVWGKKGQELFYTEQGNLMKVDVTGEPGVSFSPPGKVCSLPPSFYSLNGITHDGMKFLVAIAAKDDVDATHLNVVIGWFSELKRKFASLQK